MTAAAATAGAAWGVSSLAVVNGNPAVAFDDRRGGGVHYGRAIDALGTTWGPPLQVDVYGLRPSIAVVDGHPAIAFSSDYNFALHFVRAQDPDGTAWGATDTISSGGYDYYDIELEVVNGNPAVGFEELPYRSSFARYAQGMDPQGSNWGNYNTLEGGIYEYAGSTSLAVIGGRPAISMMVNSDLGYARGLDPDGGAWASTALVDPGVGFRVYTSVAEVNGHPGIAYRDDTNDILKYAWQNCLGLTVTPSTLADATIGAPYTVQFQSTGGTPPYTWAASQVPPGLTLTSGGSLTGTPSSLGTFGFWVTATDALGCQGSVYVDLTVTCPSTCSGSIVPAILPAATFGVPYSQQMTGTGIVAPSAMVVAAGLLPQGMTLRSDGLLSGTPASQGTFNFTLEATGTCGCRVSRDYSLLVVCSVTISPTVLPSARVGDAYQQTLSASGGSAPYAYAVTSGALPAGLSLAGSGAISGTPTTAGSSAFTVTVTDAAGCSSSQTYTLVVDARPDDYVLGQGLGQPNPNRVRVYLPTGSPTATDFLAYGAGAWGVNVGSASVDAGPDASILTGPGPGPSLGPQLRGFRPDGSPKGKVNFYTYGTLKNGVNVGAADLEADGFAEMVSGAGPGAVFGPHVRAWNFDGASVTSIAKVSFFAFATLRYGVHVGGGDLEGDGYGELLAGAGPGGVFGATVRGFDVDGGWASAIAKVNFNAFPGTYGVLAAAGDVDADGFAEIGSARGPGAANPTQLRGFDYDGAQVLMLPGFDVTPFATSFGARVGLGDLTGQGIAALVAGAGPDPVATAEVRAWEYRGGALQPFGTSFQPFAGFYGVNVSTGALGF